MLHKYFTCLIFVRKGCLQKISNNENFMIYSIGSYDNNIVAYLAITLFFMSM